MTGQTRSDVPSMVTFSAGANDIRTRSYTQSSIVDLPANDDGKLGPVGFLPFFGTQLLERLQDLYQLFFQNRIELTLKKENLMT
jgi:hypothetical protein